MAFRGIWLFMAVVKAYLWARQGFKVACKFLQIIFDRKVKFYNLKII